MDKIKEICSFLQDDLEKINQIILDFSIGKSPLIKDVAHHLISSGGKRIRPILLILASKLCDKDARNYHDLAGAIELIHTATLLHDDVVDDSKTRRGKETANAIWSNKVSILVGDFVFSIAFQLMVKSNNLKVLDLLAKASSAMADGEVMQLENSSDIDISKEKYFDIIFGKTAVLFQAACQAPALLYDKSEAEIEALKNFGKNLGIVFQIIDDILDYSSSKQQIGKGIGDDFFEGKVTLPIILAFESANQVDKVEIADLLSQNLMNEKKNPKNFEKILKFIEKYQAIEKSYYFALKYKNSALESLSVFQDSIYKEYLSEILQYSINRVK